VIGTVLEIVAAKAAGIAKDANAAKAASIRSRFPFIVLFTMRFI
jgi:hypothetical protein